MKARNGFALIEMIVAMAITLVLAGIVITVYGVQAREVRESVANAIVQRGFDQFHKDFGQDVRFASRVLDTSEAFFQSGAYPDGMTTSVVITYDRDGNVENRYSLASDTVLLNNQPFSIGGKHLTVDADSSFFILSSFRDEVIVALKLTYDDGQTNIVFKQRKGLFTCRN